MLATRVVGCRLVAVALLGALTSAGTPAPAAPRARPHAASDPLPSWTDGVTKASIVDFVETVTTEGSPDYVTPADRIAVFDNDGTLWPEKPLYVELAFVIDRIETLAPRHPEWRREQPFASILAGDLSAGLAGGKKSLLQLAMATHAGMTTAELDAIVSAWIAAARHPRFHRPYTELAYQPMLELIDYLHARGFDVYIASGGGVEFMRPWVERTYGIRRSHVIGSSIATQFEERKSGPVLVRQPRIDFIDDGPGKPVAIHKFVGRRPIAAFGNSDGDLEMLEWATAGAGRRLGLIVHHTDGEREWAYDRHSKIGKLDKALDAARRRHWTVVDMKNDWRTIFFFNTKS